MLRQALAAVLGVALGLVCIAAPGGVIRMYTVGRLPSGRHSPYGEDEGGRPLLRRGVQAAGVLTLLAGLYFGYQAFAV